MELHAALKDGLISIPQNNPELGIVSSSVAKPSVPNHSFVQSRPMVGAMRPNLAVGSDGLFSTSPLIHHLVMPQRPQGNAHFQSYASSVAGTSSGFSPPLSTVQQNALPLVGTLNTGTSSIYTANPLFFHNVEVENDKFEHLPKKDIVPANDPLHTDGPNCHTANLDKGKEPSSRHDSDTDLNPDPITKILREDQMKGSNSTRYNSPSNDYRHHVDYNEYNIHVEHDAANDDLSHHKVARPEERSNRGGRIAASTLQAARVQAAKLRALHSAVVNNHNSLGTDVLLSPCGAMPFNNHLVPTGGVPTVVFPLTDVSEACTATNSASNLVEEVNRDRPEQLKRPSMKGWFFRSKKKPNNANQHLINPAYPYSNSQPSKNGTPLTGKTFSVSKEQQSVTSTSAPTSAPTSHVFSGLATSETEKELEVAMAMDLMKLKVLQANTKQDAAMAEVLELRLAMDSAMAKKLVELERHCESLKSQLLNVQALQKMHLGFWKI
ncbi:hypothetical protein L7F22_012445 [Adiantum nelumboides]|nr:hypothetical protein [Adiantum nelumboides]